MTLEDALDILSSEGFARFWRRVRIEENGCWEWTGAMMRNGYGVFTIERGKALVRISSHRLSYFIHFGEWPGRKYVCHRCDNPRCVRPEHLFLGTAGDNNLDRYRKHGHHFHRDPSRAARGDRNGSRTHPEKRLRGEANPFAKLTAEQVRYIRAHYERGQGSALGRQFGVTPQVVSAIIHGRTWRHLLPAIDALKGVAAS